MKIFINLFITISTIVYSQKLDLNTFSKLQNDLLKLNKQLKDYVIADNPQHNEIIANIGITYTLAFSYYEQIMILAFVQKFYITKEEEKNFNIDKNSHIDGWIKTFKNLEAMFYNRQEIFYNPKLKKNIGDVIFVLDKTIDELKKSK